MSKERTITNVMTTAGELKFIELLELADYVVQDKAYSTVHQYSATSSYGDVDADVSDKEYFRKTALITNTNGNIPEFIANSFSEMLELENPGSDDIIQDVENASIDLMMDSRKPNLIVNLGNNKYSVVDSDSLKLVLLDENNGGLLQYKSNFPVFAYDQDPREALEKMFEKAIEQTPPV